MVFEYSVASTDSRMPFRSADRYKDLTHVRIGDRSVSLCDLFTCLNEEWISGDILDAIARYMSRARQTDYLVETYTVSELMEPRHQQRYQDAANMLRGELQQLNVMGNLRYQRVFYTTLRHGSHWTLWIVDRPSRKAYFFDCHKWNLKDPQTNARWQSEVTRFRSVLADTVDSQIFWEIGEPVDFIPADKTSWQCGDHTLAYFDRAQRAPNFPTQHPRGNSSPIKRKVETIRSEIIQIAIDQFQDNGASVVVGNSRSGHGNDRVSVVASSSQGAGLNEVS